MLRRLMVLVATLTLGTLALDGCSGGGGNNNYNGGPTGTGGTGGTGGTAGTGTVGPNTVNATEANSFNPTGLTVAKGTTVTFTFFGTIHNVTFSTTGAPTNIPDSYNTSVSRNFPDVGVYTFNCSIHGSYMAGTITVQ